MLGKKYNTKLMVSSFGMLEKRVESLLDLVLSENRI